jgi:alpha-tubulin suppressor-like RCC1 family protein
VLSHDGRIGCHTMAVTAAGHAWTSGGNVYGQLDVGDRTNRLGFTQVDAGQLGGARIVMAACGWLHSVVVSAEGRVWTFGRGWSGSLGHNDEQHRLVPTLLAAEVFEGSMIVTVAAGGRYIMAVGENGALWAWGLGCNGQLWPGRHQRQASANAGGGGGGVWGVPGAHPVGCLPTSPVPG